MRDGESAYGGIKYGRVAGSIGPDALIRYRYVCRASDSTVQHLNNLNSPLALTPPIMAVDDSDPDYACRCLNVRIRLNIPDKKTQERPSSAEGYESIYVGEGIVVVSMTLDHTSLHLQV